MKIITHKIGEQKLAEIQSDKILILTLEDGLDLLGNLYYQGFDKIILRETHITPEFFDLKTKLAGEILQKFSQYRMPLTIIGDFEKYESSSLRNFIYESNQGRSINFVSNLKEALAEKN